MKAAFKKGRFMSRIFNKQNEIDAIKLGYEIKELPKKGKIKI